MVRIKLLILLQVLAFLICFVSQATADNGGGIVVWKLQANEDIKESNVILLSNFVTTQVSKHFNGNVISEADIHTILKGEEKRQKCGATDTSCLVEIGNALGVPEAISGDIGKIGSFWMLNLRRLNVRSAKVIARSSVSTKGNIDILIEDIPAAVAELFEEKAPKKVVATPVIKPKPEPKKQSKPKQKPKPKPKPVIRKGTLVIHSLPKGAQVSIDGKKNGKTPFRQSVNAGQYNLELSLEEYETANKKVTVKSDDTSMINFKLVRDYPMNPYKKWGHACFWTGLVAGGLMVGIGHGKAAAVADEVRNGAVTSNEHWSNLAVAGYVVGGSLMVTGIVLWALSPGDKAWWESHQAGISPTGDGKGLAVNLGGRW